MTPQKMTEEILQTVDPNGAWGISELQPLFGFCADTCIALRAGSPVRIDTISRVKLLYELIIEQKLRPILVHTRDERGNEGLRYFFRYTLGSVGRGSLDPERRHLSAVVPAGGFMREEKEFENSYRLDIYLPIHPPKEFAAREHYTAAVRQIYERLGLPLDKPHPATSTETWGKKAIPSPTITTITIPTVGEPEGKRFGVAEEGKGLQPGHSMEGVDGMPGPRTEYPALKPTLSVEDLQCLINAQSQRLELMIRQTLEAVVELSSRLERLENNHRKAGRTGGSITILLPPHIEQEGDRA